MLPYRVLGGTGMKISVLGMGGSGFGHVYGKINEDEAICAVRHALDRGVNYFDTAYWYGQGKSETFLGKALQGVPREKFFIGTKVGRYERDIPNMFDFSADKVTRSCEESLRRLQLEYVDILQIHDVEFAPSLDLIINETLPAVRRLQERGLCRFIGITGYPLAPLRKIVEQSQVEIDCVLSYCRLSLNDVSLTNDFEFYRTKGVPVINASPLSMGLLTQTGVQEWHPAGEEIRTACAEAVKYCTDQGVDVTRLALNFSASFEEATTTLVSMVDTATVDKNVDAVTTPLTEQEKRVLEHIRKHYIEALDRQDWEDKETLQYWQQKQVSNPQ